MTREEHTEFLSAGCYICGGIATVVDHDHRCCEHKRQGVKLCGECTRGPLCSACNLGLGKFKDDPNLLRAAACYLEEWL